MADGDTDWLWWVGLGAAALVGVVAVVALAMFGPAPAESGAAVQSVYEDSGLQNHETITYTDRRGRPRTIVIDRQVH